MYLQVERSALCLLRLVFLCAEVLRKIVGHNGSLQKPSIYSRRGCKARYSSERFVRRRPKVMFDNSSSWLTSLVVAGLGASVMTSFAVGQGQSPIVALGVTAIAAVSAIAIDGFL